MLLKYIDYNNPRALNNTRFFVCYKNSTVKEVLRDVWK